MKNIDQMESSVYKTINNMPNIWGTGQLFAFSGIDGKTDLAKTKCCNANVKEGAHIFFHL